MKHLGYIADADGILLWFPSQNRRSPSPNRTVFKPKTYGFGTENVKVRLPETDSIPFNNTLAHSLLNKLSN